MDRMHLNLGAMLARAALRNAVRSAQGTARSVAKDVASVAKAHQRQLVGAGLGAVTGGGAGYLGASRGADEAEQDFRSRRLRNTLIGGAVGGALGGSVGHVTRTKQAPPTAAPAAVPTAAPAAAAPAAVPAATSRPPRQRPPRQRPPRPPKSERRAAQRRIGGGATQNDELAGFDTNTRMAIRKEIYDQFRAGKEHTTWDLKRVASRREGSSLERAAARIALAHGERDRIKREFASLQRRAEKFLAAGDDPAEVQEWLEKSRAAAVKQHQQMSELYGYRHREKRAALRDRLAMGAGVIGNLALQGRDAFNHAASAVRGGAPLLQSVEGATAHARNQLMGRTEAYDSRFTPLYPGHLTGDSNIGKTLGAYYHPADSSPLTNTVRREYINDPRVGDDDITRGLGTRLSALSGNLAGRDLSIVPTGALSPSPAFYHRDEPGLVAAGNMPALLHELGHHAVPPTPLMRTMAPYAPRFAKLLHEADAQNWAEERMTDPRYHASHGMDRPRGQLNPDASMADNGVGALRALSQGDVGTARARAEDLLNSSAALSTYGSHAAYHAPSLVGAALGAGAGLIGRGVRALRGS